MPGASGAEMKAACTEAGMFALRERRVHVTQEDFEMACAKVCPAVLPAQHDVRHFPRQALLALLSLFSVQCSVDTRRCSWHLKSQC